VEQQKFSAVAEKPAASATEAPKAEPAPRPVTTSPEPEPAPLTMSPEAEKAGTQEDSQAAAAATEAPAEG
jgi:hypothetical protein